METAIRSASAAVLYSTVQDLHEHYRLGMGPKLMKVYYVVLSDCSEVSLSAVRTYVLATMAVKNTGSIRWEKLFQSTGGPLPDESILKTTVKDTTQVYVRTRRVDGKIRYELACIRTTNTQYPSSWAPFVIAPGHELPRDVTNIIQTPKDLPSNFLVTVGSAGEQWLDPKDLVQVQNVEWMAKPTPVDSKYEHLSYKLCRDSQPDITVRFTHTEFIASIPKPSNSGLQSFRERDLQAFDKELLVLQDQLIKVSQMMLDLL
jgi:hypothetical protein